MINFNYETDFKLHSEEAISNWIVEAIRLENHKLEEMKQVNYGIAKIIFNSTNSSPKSDMVPIK